MTTDANEPPMAFTHARLLVSDYPEMFEFYRDVLGFEPTWGDEESYYADFDTGEATVALFDREQMADAVPPVGTQGDGDGTMLIFRVESVDQTAGQLRDAGIDFETEPTDREDWGIRVAHFRDPEGTLIEINEALER